MGLIYPPFKLQLQLHARHVPSPYFEGEGEPGFGPWGDGPGLKKSKSLVQSQEPQKLESIPEFVLFAELLVEFEGPFPFELLPPLHRGMCMGLPLPPLGEF